VILLVRGPDGRYIELDWMTWAHIRALHPEIVSFPEEILLTIEQPSHREPDPIPGRERLFRRGGPQAWIRVVVEFRGDLDRVVTAFPQRVDPGARDRR
jgi:hypothetical protein